MCGGIVKLKGLRTDLSFGNGHLLNKIRNASRYRIADQACSANSYAKHTHQDEADGGTETQALKVIIL